MSGNDINKNSFKINLPNGKTFNLKKLDALEGKSVSGSVFAKFDKLANGGNGDNKFDISEIDLIKSEIQKYQANDNMVSDMEISELIHGKNAAGKDDTTRLLNTLNELQTEENITQYPENNLKEEKNGKQQLTDYTVQPGDTPEVIAKKLGYEGNEAKKYAQQLKEHFKNNGFTNSRGWLMVGAKITLLGDHIETLNNMSDYSTDKEVLNNRYAQTSHAKKIEQKQIPDNVENTAIEISAQYKQCKVLKDKDDKIKLTYKTETDECQKVFDKNGKLLSITENNNDGSARMGTPNEKGEITWVKTKVSNEERQQALLPREVTYPKAVGDKIALLRNAGMKFDTTQNPDGTFTFTFIQNNFNLTQETKNLHGYLTSLSGFNENTWKVDTNGNTIEERQADLFTETVTTYKNGEAVTSSKPRIMNNDTSAKSTDSTKEQAIKKPVQKQPEKVEDLTPKQRGLYLKFNEHGLPKSVQDQIIRLRLNGDDIVQYYSLTNKDNQTIGYEIEYKKGDKILSPQPNIPSRYIGNIYTNNNPIETISIDLNGNIVDSLYTDEKTKIFNDNEIGKSPIAQKSTTKQLTNGRVTTDKVASDINITRPERLPDDGHKFADSLEENKEALMKELNLTNEQYNNLATLAMAIAEQETHFNEYLFEEKGGEYNFQGRLLKKDIARTFGYNIQSQGITQIRWGLNFEGDYQPNKTLKAQAEKFNIHGENDFKDNPKNAAILTMILLNNKRIAVEGQTWQNRLKKNNAQIDKPEDRLTNNDIIALLWNGAGNVVKRMNNQVITINTNNSGALDANGKKIKDGVSYSRLVRAYYEDYSADVRKNSDDRANKLGAIPQGNNGQIGSVIFLANKYSDKLNDQAIENDIKTLTYALNENNIPANQALPLINAVKNGEISFGYGLTPEEAKSLTSVDISNMLNKLTEVKNETKSLVDPKLIRDKAGEASNEFRSDYLNSRGFVVSNKDISSGSIISTFTNPEITNERTNQPFEIIGLEALTRGKNRSYEASVQKYNDSERQGQRTGFAVQADLGVNPYDANGNRISSANIKLAEAASDVANAMGTGGRCATGFKTALITANVDSKDNIVYPQNITYRVQEGQTFLDVAKSHGYSGADAKKFAEELKANLQKQAKIDNDGKLKVGKTISFKDTSGNTVRHTVKEGETLESIVRQYGYTGQKANEFATKLYKDLVAGVVVDTSGNLIAGKNIVVHQKGQPISTAKDLYRYFDANPEKFEQVKYVDIGNGNSREINASDITNLPAGYIVVYIPGAGFEDQAGHVVVTNGNGQGYADEVDNLRWDDFKSTGAGNGKGEHGTYKIYRLKVDE